MSEKFQEKVAEIEKKVQGQAKYFHNFMKMFELLLVFIRASR